MTDEANNGHPDPTPPGAEKAQAQIAQPEGSSAPLPNAPRLPLPGLAAIAFYLLLLAGTIILGVVSGGRYPPVYLVFSALFIAACAGLLMLFRWAWALALAAVVLLAAYNLWIFSSRHIAPALVQGLINLLFFFYLVRADVRSRLR
jgi:hypothetical protein